MLDQRRKHLAEAIAALGAGEFHFPAIYGAGWADLYVGDKVKLGRAFLNRVREGCFPGVTDVGRKTAGGRVSVNIAGAGTSVACHTPR